MLEACVQLLTFPTRSYCYVVVVMHVPVTSRCLPVQLDLTAMAIVVMHVAPAPKHGTMLSVWPYGSVLFSSAITVSQISAYL
jgi:hypothetical protein